MRISKLNQSGFLYINKTNMIQFLVGVPSSSQDSPLQTSVGEGIKEWLEELGNGNVMI